MQSVTFWAFVWKCVKRASSATLHLPGWNLRTIAVGTVLLALGFLIHLLTRGASETKKKITDHLLLKSAPAVLLVVAVFGYFLCKAPYEFFAEEHEKAESTSRLASSLETEKNQLKSSLEAEKKIPRARTGGMTENQLTTDKVEAVRCWVSNYFGLPNSKVPGAVTATSAILRCNYRIEAPFLVHVEFDREFLPGATVLPDVPGFISSTEQKKGRAYEKEVLSPSLPPEHLVIVTVYGTTDQSPRALRAFVKSIQ